VAGFFVHHVESLGCCQRVFCYCHKYVQNCALNDVSFVTASRNFQPAVLRSLELDFKPVCGARHCRLYRTVRFRWNINVIRRIQTNDHLVVSSFDLRNWQMWQHSVIQRCIRSSLLRLMHGQWWERVVGGGAPLLLSWEVFLSSRQVSMAWAAEYVNSTSHIGVNHLRSCLSVSLSVRMLRLRSYTTDFYETWYCVSALRAVWLVWFWLLSAQLASYIYTKLESGSFTSKWLT
jgi:hypothetical protein